MNDVSREYFWGCELSRENPSITWTFEEEEEDSDFLIHTLFLKHAVLGKAAVANERNIVEVETKNFDNKTIKHPILSLTNGKLDMCSLDLSFGHENAVVFRLIEGGGPVHLTAQQLVEFPDETNVTQEESELECTEEEESQSGEDEEEASPVKPLSKKRKASIQTTGKPKKGKMEVSEPFSSERIVHQITSGKGETGSLQITFQPGKEEEEEEEMEDDEDEEEEISSEEEEMEESEESSPEKGKKKKVSKEKAKPKPAKKPKKQTTPKATAGKKKKVGKK